MKMRNYPAIDHGVIVVIDQICEKKNRKVRDSHRPYECRNNPLEIREEFKNESFFLSFFPLGLHSIHPLNFLFTLAILAEWPIKGHISQLDDEKEKKGKRGFAIFSPNS